MNQIVIECCDIAIHLRFWVWFGKLTVPVQRTGPLLPTTFQRSACQVFAQEGR